MVLWLTVTNYINDHDVVEGGFTQVFGRLSVHSPHEFVCWLFFRRFHRLVVRRSQIQVRVTLHIVDWFFSQNFLPNFIVSYQPNFSRWVKQRFLKEYNNKSAIFVPPLNWNDPYLNVNSSKIDWFTFLILFENKIILLKGGYCKESYDRQPKAGSWLVDSL